MKALLISPPFVPMYVNTDYNFVEIGEVAAFLDEEPRIELEVADYSVLNAAWPDVLNQMLTGYDVLIIHNTIENFEAVRRTVELSRTAVPEAPIATYGRLGVHTSEAFERLGIDVIVLEQDWELPLKRLCLFCHNQRGNSETPIPMLPGCKVRRSGVYQYDGPGQHLGEDWRLPLLPKLPLNAYRVFDDEGGGLAPDGTAKPSGELAIGMSRGCDARCGYCPIPKVNGYRERFRQHLEDVASYFSVGESEYGFATASLFSANFTKDADYVHAFCRMFVESCNRMSWTCVTEPRYLNQNLVEIMAGARCSRVAVGVESLRVDGSAFFKWRTTASDLEQIASWFHRVRVKLVGFVMVGIPNQEREEIRYTLQTLRDLGIVPRPMIYTNFRELSSLTTPDDSFWFNRQLVVSRKKPSDLTNREKMLITKDWEKWLREQAQ